VTTPRATGPSPDGFLVVDKPAGLTSHDVVDRVRRALGTRKVGHAGTLDPDATGVLLVGVGKATRLLRYVGSLPKSYTGEVVLGSETTTLDSAGEVVATFQMAVSLDDARAAAQGFVGDILQVPPMVSALKVGGRRLHELAREGIEVEREARPVTVWRFDVVGAPTPGVLSVEVDCSSGTYVRSLAADLGRALGGGAHLRNLRRTAIGPHTSTCPLDELVLHPLLAAVAHLDQVEVDDEVAALVRIGRRLVKDGPTVFAGDGPWAVLRDGELLAVYETKGEQAVPGVVLPSE
jgi:tRNA pseudouridine55 synthase